MGDYDYIVVGGGSSGCIVAAELAGDPSNRVLLLEGGPAAEQHPETLVAAGVGRDGWHAVPRSGPVSDE